MSSFIFAQNKRETLRKVDELCYKGNKTIESLMSEFREMTTLNDYEYSIFEFMMKILPEQPKAVFFHHGWGPGTVKLSKSENVKSLIQEQLDKIKYTKAKMEKVEQYLNDFNNWCDNFETFKTDRSFFEIEKHLRAIIAASKDADRTILSIANGAEYLKLKPFKTKELYILASDGPIQFKKFPNVEMSQCFDKIRTFFGSTTINFPMQFPWISLPAAVNHKSGEAVVYIGYNNQMKKILLLNDGGKWEFAPRK
jgi:hypothetical protein